MADTNSVHIGAPAPAAIAPSYDVRLVKVETDVAGLKGDIGKLEAAMTTGLEKVGAAIAAKGQVNWQPVTIAATIVMALLAFGWSQLGEQKAAATHFVSRDDIDDKFRSAREVAELKAQIAEAKAMANTARLDRIGVDLADIEAKIVPLSTHQELWKNQAETNKALAAKIDENSKALADITAPKDTISRIEKHIDDLDERTRK